MKTVHHRSRGYEEQWEYDAGQKRIHLVLKMGNRIIAPEPVRVCSPLRPAIGGFVIVRRSTGLEVWELTAGQFDFDLDYARSCQIHPDVNAQAFCLVSAPDNISLEMLEL